MSSGGRARSLHTAQSPAGDPYAPPAPGCSALQAEIARFDEALGEDYDDPDAKKDEQGVSKPVFGAVASAVTGVIPMRGWIRKLSGADKHDQQVREAIKAGFVRRGYLKGLHQASACKGGRVTFVSAAPAPKPVLVAAPERAVPQAVTVADATVVTGIQ